MAPTPVSELPRGAVMPSQPGAPKPAVQAHAVASAPAAPEELCGVCGREIMATQRSTAALNQKFHSGCLTCRDCSAALIDTVAFHNGKPVCQACHAKATRGKSASSSADTSSACAGCKGILSSVETTVKALDAAWHPNCFTCCECKTVLSASAPFAINQGKPFCNACRDKKIEAQRTRTEPVSASTEMCAGCHKQLLGKVFEALGGTYHPECFFCTDCSKPITTGKFKNANGKAVCLPCSELRLQKAKTEESAHICVVCHETIAEKAMVSYGKEYHPACFKCSQCSAVIPAGQYVAGNDQSGGPPVCLQCARKGTKSTWELYSRDA
eukprot:TRINITY_DN2170_c0_g1_i2.p1 TRINITY_DN2170_c0_g1~~TRINITY_DN2170_c0_g1_i2.p1  ORF type:complete len:326 (-),score=32.91 TRINITY_DN2170_c0_g1_i2:34-1011(-)